MQVGDTPGKKWQMVVCLGLFLILVLGISFGFGKGFFDIYTTLLLAAIVAALLVLVMLIIGWRDRYK